MDNNFRLDSAVLCALFVTFCTSGVLSQSCSISRTCETCLRLSSECSWCQYSDFGRIPRCMDQREVEASLCKNVTSPSRSTFIYRKFTRFIAPQSMKIRLQYGSPVSILIRIKIPENIKISKKNKLMLKYRDHVKDYKQTFDVLNKKSRVIKKGNKQIIKNVIGNGSIIVNYTLESSVCGLKKQKIPIWIRLVSKGKTQVKHKFKTVLEQTDCPCGCSDVERDSALCYGHGSHECGVCKCNPGFYGDRCEIDTNPELLNSQCIAPGSNKVCSGRGTCIAGFCACQPIRPYSIQKYSGKYCSCDDYSCSYHNNQMCGGHGRCTCGTCICDEGFTGEACDCPVSPSTCMADNGEICNGVGTCECGVCRCDPSTYYRGPTCEDCPTCPGTCWKLRPCAMCVGFATGPYSRDECYEKCDIDNISLVDQLEDEKEDSIKLCQFRDEEDDCLVFFNYHYDSLVIRTHVQRTKICPYK